VPRSPEGPPPPPAVQRLRLRYAKRGRLRFSSHRDFQRALERALRRAEVPMAYSAGFTPHPKVSYANAAATGVASEAEYVEIALVRVCDPEWVRTVLDRSLPDGLDVVEVVEATPGTTLADRLEASVYEIRLDGVEPERAAAAAEVLLAADRVEIERLTRNGPRRFDARGPVVELRLADERVDAERSGGGTPCAILRLVVRHTTPAVRPDDVLEAMRQVALLAAPVPPQVTRLAQGPLDAASRVVSDPLVPDRATIAGPYPTNFGPPAGGPHNQRLRAVPELDRAPGDAE
jgi:radical SAM-linked protein